MAENNKIPPPPPDDDDVVVSSKTVPPPPPDDEPEKKNFGSDTGGRKFPVIFQYELQSQSGTTEPTGIPKISPETKKRIEDITEIKLPELEPIDTKVPLLPEVEPPQYWVGGQEMSKEDFIKSLENPDTIRKFKSGEIGINVKNDAEVSTLAQQKFSDVPELEQNDGSLGDRINTFAGNFLRGGVKTLVSEPLKALGEAETAFSRLFHRKVWGEQYSDKVKIEDDPFYKAGKFIEEKVLPTITYANPAYDNEFLTRDVAEGFGQGVAYLLAAPKTVAMEGIGLLKSSPKIASATKTALSEISKQTFSKPAVVGALNMASAEYEQAKAAADEARKLPEGDYINLKIQQGATPELAKQQYDFLNSEAPEDIAFNVFLKSLPAGTIESFSAGRLLQRLDKVTGGSVKQTLATMGKNAVSGGVDGLVQESIQQAYSNLTAQQTYDKTREIIDGVVRSGGAGATVQSTMNALAAVLGIKIKGAKTPLQEKTFTEAQALANNTIDEIESNINEAEKAVKEATGEKKQPTTAEAEVKKEAEKSKTETDETKGKKEEKEGNVLTKPAAEAGREALPGVKTVDKPDDIYYTGRGKKFYDLKETMGSFIFFSKNPKVSEWYGGDESNVTSAKLDTSNFLDLSSQEKKAIFIDENITDEDIDKLYPDISTRAIDDRDIRKSYEEKHQILLNEYRQRLKENRFSGDNKEQKFLLNKAKEKGYSGVKLSDSFFGKEDLSYVVIDKNVIQPSQEAKGAAEVAPEGKTKSETPEPTRVDEKPPISEGRATGQEAGQQTGQSKGQEYTPEEKAQFEKENEEAKELGFDSAPHALNSINKASAIEYKSFAEIPKEELKKYAEERQQKRAEEKEPERAQTFDAAEQQSLKFTAPQTETERKKSFLETIKGSPMTTEELNKATEELNEFYNVISNKEATKKADKEIEKSFAKAKEKVLSDSAPTAEKSVIALRLIKHYEKIGHYDSAVELIDAYDRQLREAGRFIQAASLWNKLSPESVLRVTDKVADKYGKKLKPDVRKTILKKLSEIDKMPEGIEKTEKTLEVLNYIADQFPPTLRELFDAYRYQNMLSNPRSHERNIVSNLLNTFIIRPATLTSTATYDLFRSMFNPAARDYEFSDAPVYIKEAITAVPQAMKAFMEGFRSGKITDKLIETDGTVGAIEAARQSKIPKYLTVAVRLMEAQDRFFTALISQGEKGRLMAQGVDEKAAQEKGIKLAEKYLYREKLGLNDEEINVISRALSSLGNYISKGRNIPYVGGVYGWFVPFVRTPINVAKVAIEFTPLGLVGGKYGKEQVGTALLGTTIMGIGALMAAQGLTTWTPPEDKKERELFYASGRKPFSIKIGDKWVPMIYAGPLSLSLAFPAAIKHFQDYTKTALTDGDIEQITEAIFSMAKFITSQTSVSSVDGFYKSIEGDIDTKSGKVLGFTTTQAIPFSGLVRWINMWLDPIYRKVATKPFWESYLQSIEKDLPVLSKDLEPYPTPSGKPAEREPSSTLLPWDIGFSDKDYDILLEKRRNLLQKREKRKEKGGLQKRQN